MKSLGIDSGSTMTKGIVYDGNTIIKKMIQPTTENPGKVVRSMYEELNGETISYTVSTGYGRNLLEMADKKITEITCHAAGASYLCPDCNAVIDIGGQDSKVMLIDEAGRVTDFLMNDKCAAGTGRFIEMSLKRVGSNINRIDEFVQGCKPEPINSMCAVFAESEIIGLLANEKLPGDIILGCLHSICRRTAVFAQKLVHKNDKIFFSGGLSQSQAVMEILNQYLEGCVIETSPLACYTGAVGAAVLGYKKIQGEQ